MYVDISIIYICMRCDEKLNSKIVQRVKLSKNNTN